MLCQILLTFTVPYTVTTVSSDVIASNSPPGNLFHRKRISAKRSTPPYIPAPFFLAAVIAHFPCAHRYLAAPQLAPFSFSAFQRFREASGKNSSRTILPSFTV